MKKIYLACPYSHPDLVVQEQRFLAVNAEAARRMAAGEIVFSPISHTHPIALAGDLPKGWDFWEQQDRAFLEWCDELHVLMLPGWDVSVGVTAEISTAIRMDKPVFYQEPKCEF